jgi:hypothetical protein
MGLAQLYNNRLPIIIYAYFYAVFYKNYACLMQIRRKSKENSKFQLLYWPKVAVFPFGKLCATAPRK